MTDEREARRGDVSEAVAEPALAVAGDRPAAEPFEELYRRFKRGIEASGLLREYRQKQRFKPAHEVRRDKIRSAARKKRRALTKSGGRNR